ncbi:hypothetical protein SAY87_018095 [Trapa incisa]|uniref:Protein MIZU-KUSSEI 1 n=1 Tax=Trapa incisa TaxID=236973 RepID=A0AAN7L7R1_9MYRT|nr:hypothetical protein SAY87_018095 [Trapa incisa]
MKTVLNASPHESSFSFSRRFNWRKKLIEDEDGDDDREEILRSVQHEQANDQRRKNKKKKKKFPQLAVSKLRSVLRSMRRGGRGSLHAGDVSRVVGTLFGYRRGSAHFAVQSDPREEPVFLIQLAASTSVLVREMASGVVRIVLECDRKVPKEAATGKMLLEEPLWRSYCNGRRCGYGLRRECGPEEARVLGALQPVSMGAGVIPGNEGEGHGGEGDMAGLGELMYMRARFERVIGSKDSEALYMMNPEGTGDGPELSFYVMRI